MSYVLPKVTLRFEDPASGEVYQEVELVSSDRGISQVIAEPLVVPAGAMVSLVYVGEENF